MKIPMSMRRRWLTTTLAVAALGGFFALIVASPWLIGSIVGHSEDWRRLSDVGQAYGGISAILSGLAFCGIAGSLLLQWRQVRQAQMAAVHERHFELVRLAIEDTDLRAPGPAAPAGAEAKQWVYFNLWVAHWAMRWDIRALGRQEARKQLATLFYDDAASRWWLACGPLWSINADERRRAFVALVEEAYQNVAGPTPDQTDTQLSSPTGNRPSTGIAYSDGSVTVAAGVPENGGRVT